MKNQMMEQATKAANTYVSPYVELIRTNNEDVITSSTWTEKQTTTFSPWDEEWN